MSGVDRSGYPTPHKGGNMKKRRMHMSKARKLVDARKTNWAKHLEVFMLRNQGWEYHMIGDKLGISKMRACTMYHKVKDMTVEELENNIDKFGGDD